MRVRTATEWVGIERREAELQAREQEADTREFEAMTREELTAFLVPLLTRLTAAGAIPSVAEIVEGTAKEE